MAPHDQLFKQLLEALLGDFLELVVPHLAPRLDVGRRRFLSNETFTDQPQGEHRVLDLVAEIPSRDADGTEDDGAAGSELVLVHVEIERDWSAAMGERLWDYTRTLVLRHDRPVLPMVLYLRGGPPGATRETVHRNFLGEVTETFHYYSLGLSGVSADEYVELPQPLAWALAALMKTPETWSPAEHQLACLEPIVRSHEIDEATRYLLLNCVETYLELDENDWKEFNMLVEDRKFPRLEDIKMTWGDRKVLEGRRQTVLEQLESRFGVLPAATRSSIQALTTEDELRDLARKVLDARSLEELGLT
jgi:hypothetical protein